MGLGDNLNTRSPHSAYLPSIRPDQTLTPAFIGKIIQGIDNSTPRFGNGYQIANYSGGSVLRINTPSVAGNPTTNFQVNAFIENGQAKATVSVGTVNRVIPKINGRYLDQLINRLPPTINIMGLSGYIVLEVLAEANKPFPSNVSAKYVTTYENTDTSGKSTYPLAKITGIPATTGKEAEVLVDQIHLEGNLGVSRFKVGQNIMYFQWYTV